MGGNGGEREGLGEGRGGEGGRGGGRRRSGGEVSINKMIGKICYRLATDADSRGNSNQSGGEVLQDTS